MKVQLIVVQGRPEGKVIPLSVPRFKIGRGEGCHLRPNNEQVSREHTEIIVDADRVSVRDLGSRNGTLVNNQLISGEVALKSGDLIQVGPLTFAIGIEGAPASKAETAAPAAPARARPVAKAASIDDVSNDDIDSWLVSDESKPAPDRPSGVYTGDTQTFAAYKKEEKDAGPSKAKPSPAANVPKKGPAPVVAKAPKAEPEPEPEPEPVQDDVEEDAEAMASEAPEEPIDESNPFHVKKEPEKQKAPPKPSNQDSSEAANKILQKMMERRRSK